MAGNKTAQWSATTQQDLRSMIRFDVEESDEVLDNRINEAFINVLKDYYVQSVFPKLVVLDKLPNCVLKSFSIILAPAITDIYNASFREGRVPKVWKMADVPPVPKTKSITDFNKDMRPISLTPALSKMAENIIKNMN